MCAMYYLERPELDSLYGFSRHASTAKPWFAVTGYVTLTGRRRAIVFEICDHQTCRGQSES